MSADTATTEPGAGHATDHDDEHKHGLDDSGYVRIFLFLVVVTAAEVALSYISEPLGWLFIPLLLLLMAVKFFTVASFFMHLRFDSKIFSLAFYGGLIVAIGVFIGTLQAFEFFQLP